jgi:hypothetical protein
LIAKQSPFSSQAVKPKYHDTGDMLGQLEKKLRQIVAAEMMRFNCTYSFFGKEATTRALTNG